MHALVITTIIPFENINIACPCTQYVKIAILIKPYFNKSASISEVRTRESITNKLLVRGVTGTNNSIIFPERWVFSPKKRKTFVRSGRALSRYLLGLVILRISIVCCFLFVKKFVHIIVLSKLFRAKCNALE